MTTEFPIPLFLRFRHVLFCEFPCPAWAVASCRSGPQAGELPKTYPKNQLYEWWDGKLCSVQLIIGACQKHSILAPDKIISACWNSRCLSFLPICRYSPLMPNIIIIDRNRSNTNQDTYHRTVLPPQKLILIHQTLVLPWSSCSNTDHASSWRTGRFVRRSDFCTLWRQAASRRQTRCCNRCCTPYNCSCTRGSNLKIIFELLGVLVPANPKPSIRCG